MTQRRINNILLWSRIIVVGRGLFFSTLFNIVRAKGGFQHFIDFLREEFIHLDDRKSGMFPNKNQDLVNLNVGS